MFDEHPVEERVKVLRGADWRTGGLGSDRHPHAGGVKTPYETPVARRSFVSAIMPSPRASLYANGQCVSEGNAEVFVSQGRGIFWPIDGKRLDTPYPEAHLYVTGLSGAIDLKDVHQCSGSPSHWEFVMA
jgi:hypothetical protein